MDENSITWDFTQMYESDEDPQIKKDIKVSTDLISTFVNKWKGTTEYLKNEKVLKKALDEYNHIFAVYGIVYKPLQYFYAKVERYKLDEEIKARFSRVESKYVELVNKIQFFENSLSRVKDKNLQQKFLESELLSEYKHMLERSFREGRYTLSDNEEKIINLSGRPAHGAWTSMVEKFISREKRDITIDGKTESYNFGKLMTSIISPNESLRRQAGLALHDINKANSDLATEELNAILENHRNIDSVRGRKRPDLKRHIDDDIDSSVVDALVEAVSSRNNIAHEYYKKKATRMRKNKIFYYERAVPVGKISVDVPYEKAVDITNNLYSELDPELGELVKKYHEEGRVDPFPAEGKNSGGFLLAIGVFMKPYILMNYSEKPYDVMVLAHELGHGVHHELTAKGTKAIYEDLPMSLAEVASTFFEGLAFNKVLELVNTEEDKEILAYDSIDQDLQSIFRQIALYGFETELHANAKEEGYLSTDKINNLFVKHMKSYMGDSVEFDPGSEYWWVYWGHIRSFFYVYSYAFGTLISKSLQRRIKRDPTFISAVKKILSAGSSRSPKDLFADVGIDITDVDFWNEGLDEIEEAVNKL